MDGIRVFGNIIEVISALKAIKSSHKTVVDYLDKVRNLKVDTEEEYVFGLMLDDREVI